jgi:3-dehydroquinate synthase
MIKKTLKTQTNNVPIFIGDKIISISLLKSLIKSKDVVIITNVIVAKYHLKNLKNKLRGFNILTYIIPDGEKYKNIKTLQQIHDYLIKNKYDRSLTIVALGGGVIGDMVAFAADTFMRGVQLIHIPTTLLAQVDSSIGGKCGINHPLGKNMIGSFKHPSVILMDSAVLKTLPKREFMAGMAEVIKYGLIKNKSFFKFIDNNYSKIIQQNTDCLLRTIFTCASIKAQVVKEDELESGIRAILNFGHTFGHAIEASKNYKGILHGEAISVGMNIASAISADQGYLTHDEYCNIEDMLLNMQMPTMIPKKITSASIMKHIGHDKKKISGKNRFILLDKIGNAFINDKLDNKYLKEISKNFIR